ncbi:MAG: GNAT family N-acetyltransferase [Alphaproteobacteria bacterium]|nr:MAG: GNAT family N-acetyltransferase [Alphaproteobacteria bacterium]
MAKYYGRSREYLIREALDSDGPCVQRLIADIFSEYEGVVFVLDELPDLEAPRRAFKERGGCFYVVEHGGEVVACVAFVMEADLLRAELYRLYVDKNHRGEGLGQHLLEKVERIVRAKHVQEMHLWTDVLFVDAHRLYMRNGYTKLKENRALNDVSDTIEFHFTKVL